MNNPRFDALRRQAAAVVSRRTSLLALGATALMAVAGPEQAGARSGRDCGLRLRQCKDQCRRRLETLCERQIDQCFDVVNAFCNGDLGCIAALSPCCRKLNDRCDATDALVCFVSAN